MAKLTIDKNVPHVNFYGCVLRKSTTYFTLCKTFQKNHLLYTSYFTFHYKTFSVSNSIISRNETIMRI